MINSRNPADLTADPPLPHVEPLAHGPAGAQPAMVAVMGRNVEVPEHFRAHVVEKLATVVRSDVRSAKYTVELFHEGNPRQAKLCQRVEIAITGPGPTTRAEGSGPDFYVALAAALAKLQVRVRRTRDRRRVRHGRRLTDSLRTATPRRAVSEVGAYADFRLPRSTADLAADVRSAEGARRMAATDHQRAAVRLRMESLAERQRDAARAAAEVMP